jgi:dolichol-phosphate mannosyltransferase
MSETSPRLSIVVPVRDEAPNIRPLIQEIRAALAAEAAEIVYVDDGSADETLSRLREAAQEGGTPLRILRHRRSAGQSAALLSGIRAARGVWIATLDGDGQNDPADIPRLFALAESEERRGRPLLVAGWRRERHDEWRKRLASRLANGLRARLLGDRTPDTGCGLKIFRRADFLDLPHFDHMHRFLPALFLRAGGRVVSVPVRHRPRQAGRSHYGTLDRLAVGLADLAGVMWLMRRPLRPEVLPLDEGGEETPR